MKSGCYRFGVFEFDAEKHELRRNGATIHLQSQPARVLACLIENANRTVTRDELRAAIWGNETFVDFERGLNFCISQIRSTLGDDSAQPVYIQTFPKRGYQFIAPMEFIPREIPAPRESVTVSSAPVTGRRGWMIVATAVILVAAGGFTIAHYLHRSANANQLPIIAVLRFDNETGNPDATRFSDSLTDNVVERLSTLSNGKYGVIGNAQILRVPREQRDLTAIATSLNAKYVVLGQVQADGDKTRILAHLIHLPDQIHVWVVRTDGRSLTDPLTLETELAQKIGDQFSIRVMAGAVNGSWRPAASR